MSALGFKVKVDSLTCVLRHLYTADSSDSPLVRHLMNSEIFKISVLYTFKYIYFHLPDLVGSFRFCHTLQKLHWQNRNSQDQNSKPTQTYLPAKQTGRLICVDVFVISSNEQKSSVSKCHKMQLIFQLTIPLIFVG